MAEESTLLRAVKTLNPVPLEEADTADDLREEIRQRIAAEADSVRPTDVVPQPISRPTRRILAGAAAAVLLMVGVYTLSPQQTPEAYADWTATPTELAATELDDTAQMCPPPEIHGNGETVDVTPILAEQRGDYRLMLSVGEGGASQWCFVWPDPDAERGFQSQGEGLIPGDPAPAPESTSVQVLAAEPWEPSLETAPITVAMGTAGADVTGVRVSTANGSFADATVTDGWWIVWFPDRVELGDTITVTTASGSQQMELQTGP